MGRAWLYCLAGAGIGFLAGFVIVGIANGTEPKGDATFVSLCLGTFLAGAGAIAGAILGAAAEAAKRAEQARYRQDVEKRPEQY
jgi:hypothetical protein